MGHAKRRGTQKERMAQAVVAAAARYEAGLQFKTEHPTKPLPLALAAMISLLIK